MSRNRRIKERRFKRKLLLLLLLIPAVFLLFNLKAIDDWWNFSVGVIKYQNHNITPVDCTIAPYDNLCNMAQLSTELRTQYLKEKIREYSYDYTEIPIRGGSRQDVAVIITASAGEPYTVFSAHYDKKMDDAEMAMDNTAGVYALLAVLYKLRTEMHSNNIAVVFTGEEETGFYGASAFISFAAARNLNIGEYIVVDSIGRGITYIGSTGSSSGFLFRVPFGKEKVYAPYWWNEQKWFRAKDYKYPNPLIVEKFRKIARENNIPFSVYDKMIAWGEDEQYSFTGTPTVRVYSDDFQYYFKKIHTLEDKVEYMDKKSLDETVQILTHYAVS